MTKWQLRRYPKSTYFVCRWIAILMGIDSHPVLRTSCDASVLTNGKACSLWVRAPRARVVLARASTARAETSEGQRETACQLDTRSWLSNHRATLIRQLTTGNLAENLIQLKKMKNASRVTWAVIVINCLDWQPEIKYTSNINRQYKKYRLNARSYLTATTTWLLAPF